MAQNNITGVRELNALLDRVGRAPAKALTKATKKGARIMLNEVKSNAPKDTGLLKKSMKLKAEKRRVGKKVYQIMYKGEGLVKISGNGNRSFYPVSQEYGWKLLNGNKVQGKFFQRKAFQRKKQEVERTVVTELTNAIREITG